MPRKPFRVSFGPFDIGLMNGIDPALLPPGAAQTATNVDLSLGTLRGIYTPGSVDTVISGTTGADVRGIFFQSNYRWIVDTRELWGMADYDLVNAVRTSYSNNYSAGVATIPQRWHDGSTTAEDLGIVAPTSLVQAWTGAAGSSWKQFAVTYVTSSGWESNPYFSNFFASAKPNDADLTLPVSPDGRVTARKIYCTNNGDPYGTFRYLATVADNSTTTYADVGSPDPSTSTISGQELDWLTGGSFDSPPYLFDHAQAPILSLISDSLHAAVPGVTAPGGGIVLAANGSTVRWCQSGYPERWPSRNKWAAPEDVRAILSHRAQSLVFTGSGVYGVSGTDDNTLSFSKLGAEVGVRAACGKTVWRTPFGVVYLSRQGLMMLAGDECQPFLRDALSPDFWANLTAQATTGGGLLGASYGRHYYVFGGDKTVILDFTRWPKVAVSSSDIVITAAHVTQFDGAGSGQGLYVSKKNDRDGSNHPQIRPWMYDNPNARGTQAAWVWKTGRLATVRDGISQATDKTGSRLHIRKTGTPTVKVYYDGSLVSTRVLGSAIGEGSTWIQLPTGRWKYMEVQIEGAGASDEVFGFDIEGQVYDAA